jgi:hypothetical protein
MLHRKRDSDKFDRQPKGRMDGVYVCDKSSHGRPQFVVFYRIDKTLAAEVEIFDSLWIFEIPHITKLQPVAIELSSKLLPKLSHSAIWPTLRRCFIRRNPDKCTHMMFLPLSWEPLRQEGLTRAVRLQSRRGKHQAGNPRFTDQQNND